MGGRRQRAQRVGLCVLGVVGCLSVPPAQEGTTGDSTGATTSSATEPSTSTSTSTSASTMSTATSTTSGSTGTPDDVTALLLSAPETDLPAGATISITGTVSPSTAAMPGLTFSVATDAGELRGPNGDGSAIEVTTDDTGTVTFGIRVAVDTPLGTMVTLDSDAPMTGGDTMLTVADPRLAPVVVGGNDYQAAMGFTLTSMLDDLEDRAVLVGNNPQIAFPPEGSAFPPQLHIGIRGTAETFPSVYRLEDGGLTFISSSPGDPDEGLSQIAFSNPMGPHGDYLYWCAASVDSGDGVFTVDFAGGWSTWLSFNNCNGMVFDVAKAVDDPQFDEPLYLDVSATTVQQLDDSMNATDVILGLPTGASGYKLFVNVAPPFDTGLYLVFPGVSPPGTDGAILRADAASGWNPSAVLSGLPGPRTAYFTAGSVFGGLMYVYLEIDGELRGYRPDLSSFVLVDGLVGVVDVELDRDGLGLWVSEGGRGKLMHLTWP